MAGSNTRKCVYCNASINISTEEYVKVGNRYAHKNCYEEKLEHNKQRRDLNDYIKYLFLPYEPDWKMIGSQIKRYEDEGMSLYGMRYTLEYFYAIKRNKIDYEKGIGIIPYAYKEAQSYYKNVNNMKTQKIKIENSGDVGVDHNEEIIFIDNPTTTKKLIDFTY